MEFDFKYKNTKSDIWQLYMYHIYGSVAGVSNIILVCACFSLILFKWATLSYFIKIILCLLIIFILIVQPFVLYVKASKYIITEVHINFSDLGIMILSNNKNTKLSWDKVLRISKKPTLIIVFTTKTHGYVINNKVLGNKKDDFYNFLVSKINVT